VTRWLDFSFITPPNLFTHALCWTREVGTKKLRKAAWLIWKSIFNDRLVEVVELVDVVVAMEFGYIEY